VVKEIRQFFVRIIEFLKHALHSGEQRLPVTVQNNGATLSIDQRVPNSVSKREIVRLRAGCDTPSSALARP